MNRREAIKSLALLPMALSMNPQPEAQYKVSVGWDNPNSHKYIKYIFYNINNLKKTIITEVSPQAEWYNGEFNIEFAFDSSSEAQSCKKSIENHIPKDAKVCFYSEKVMLKSRKSPFYLGPFVEEHFYYFKGVEITKNKNVWVKFE